MSSALKGRSRSFSLVQVDLRLRLNMVWLYGHDEWLVVVLAMQCPKEAT